MTGMVADAESSGAGGIAAAVGRLLRQPRMWPLAAYGVGLVIGPLSYGALVGYASDGGSSSAWRMVWTAVATFGVVGSLFWFAGLTRAYLRVPGRRALALVVPVLGAGSAVWVVLARTEAPFVGFVGLIADWLLLSLPYALTAAAVRPAGGARWRVASVVAVVALAGLWAPAASALARDRNAAAMASLGLPSSMYRVIDLPGYLSGPYTAYQGALILGYDHPNESPMAPGDDLVLTVVRARSAAPCLDGRPGPGDAALGGSCRAATGSGWWFTDAAGDTTLVETDHGMFVGMTVDSVSDAPVPPSRLPALFATLHTPDTDELSAIAAGNG